MNPPERPFYKLLGKPWWLRAFTKKHQWVTVAPKIYHPPKTAVYEEGDKCKVRLSILPILKHEEMHLCQQRRAGKWRFLFAYIFSRRRRLKAEAEAVALELANRDVEQRHRCALSYSRDLAGAPYFWAAESQKDALDAIVSEAMKLGVAL